MRFTDRVASVHPVVVTIAFLTLFIGGAVGMNTCPLGGEQWALLYSLTMLALMAPVLLWHYSIYRATSDRSAEFVGHKGRRAFLFALCAISVTVFLATFPIWMSMPVTDSGYRTLFTINAISMFVGCISYFPAIWAAANALSRFDEQRKKVEFHKTLGTFILEAYFPIGIWFIYRRIRKATDSPAPA